MARIAVWILALLAVPAFAGPDKGPFRKIAVIKLREESGSAIDPSVKTSVLRRIEEIRAWGADCVIVDIESYGGLVTSSIETADEIFALGRDVHTIAYVHRKAISGAAMLSFSCQEIVMSNAGKIGDSQVVMMTADGKLERAPEKMQTTVAATFRSYAEGNGYPVPIAESMVRQEMEVLRYKEGAGYVYFRSDTPDTLPSQADIDVRGLKDPEVVVREDELPTFTAAQAMTYGICSRIEPGLDALLESLKTPATAVQVYEWNWAEKVSRWLLGIRFLLFLGGLGSIYLALKTPGTGVPEIAAIIFFGLFFGASAIAGFVGSIEVIIFVTGIVLIAVEIFVLPGLGVAGIAGLLCVLGAVALAAIPAGEGQLPASPGAYLLPMAQDFLLAAIGALILAVLLVRALPKIPFFHALILASQPAGTLTASAAPVEDRSLLGEAGVAATPLRPAGRATIGSKEIDVVTEGAYVREGASVKVVAVRGNVIVVRPEESTTA